MEHELLQALQSFYYEGKSIMSTKEFDNLKEELTWEGRSVVMLSSNEQTEVLEAAMAYVFGNPIMTDEEYDQCSKYEEALDKFEYVLGSKPELNEASIASHNIACCYSKLNEIQAGLSALKDAKQSGFEDFNQIGSNPDLENIKKSKEFEPPITTRKSRTGDEVFPGDICRPGKPTKRQKSVQRGTNSDRLFSQSSKKFSRATCRPG
ncbi:protein MET1, chloroplastic [Tanacetum coccineum]